MGLSVECFGQHIAAFLHSDQVVSVEKQDWLVACEVSSTFGETTTRHDTHQQRKQTDVSRTEAHDVL